MNCDHDLLEKVIELAKKVSESHRKYYAKMNLDIKYKADNSPVTEADLAAHDLILSELTKLNPNWPVISEEGVLPNFNERKNWNIYWLVDPLDGTKEFIKKTGEFTVNIALINNNIPVLGVVGVPFQHEYYWGVKNGGAYWQTNEGTFKISVLSPSREPLKVTLSRHYTNESLITKLLKNFPNYEETSCGSTLKMCLVARGIVDLYPRFGPTGEWDTAAGQCIIEAAGGKVLDFQGLPLQYNTRDHLLNPDFLAGGCLSKSMLEKLGIT